MQVEVGCNTYLGVHVTASKDSLICMPQTSEDVEVRRMRQELTSEFAAFSEARKVRFSTCHLYWLYFL